MNSLWAPRATEEAADVSTPIDDVADTGEPVDVGPAPEHLDKPPVPPPPSRPLLQRNAMQAVSPAPDESAQDRANASDAMPGLAAADTPTLLQLRRIVEEVKYGEPVAYDFTYTDIGPHAEEIDEWFMYQFWQWVRLNSAQKAFEWHWDHDFGGAFGWDDADNELRARFAQAAIAGVESNDAALRSASIGKLVYLVLGRWGDTAMPNATAGDCHSVAGVPQLQAIKAGVECLTSLEGLPVIWEALRSSFSLQWSGDSQQSNTREAQDELMNLMTIMYIAVQETLNDPEDMSSTYGKLISLKPSLVDFMFTATANLRWDEQNVMPQTHIFLLFWKSILLNFGGTKELDQLKKATSETNGDEDDKETIKASPLDYHIFRQEITSKYPAYVPPRPSIPLEADNTSLLPLPPTQSSRNTGTNGIIPISPNAQNGGASILHQPVHIATPAPSPPPSPGVGGKAGKKQNYQTNQNFPFMYPPLDASSNSAGGKGLAGLSDALFSRKWEGSDIPASILEAGELFSKRVRMTRATHQLWDERERFLKSERGWDDEDEDDDDEIEDLDLNELTLEEREILEEIKAESKKEKGPPPPADRDVDFGPRPGQLSEREKQRLVAVENFYRDALPHLQSLVIVLLRPILANVTAVVAQQPSQAPAAMGRGNNPGPSPGVNGVLGPRPDGTGQNPVPEAPEPSPEELDASRTREITTKATTGTLLLLLKWLRMSHVLKFEYFTQLLLDSNYIPLVLKLLAHQDIQLVVDSKMDRVEHSFFQFCNMRSRSKGKESDEEIDDEEMAGQDAEEAEAKADAPAEDDSEDEAAPPPIKRRRSPPVPPSEPTQEEVQLNQGDVLVSRPEVDELGFPVNPLPLKPITDFSRRNFFSLINYLRVMQKICKHKAHRNLLLVQYKSSTILRKSLRVPQPELRLYTLKLFKNQVPYCGRKWRQSNMRVITAVYLHCRPELRDEWLAGSDVDAEVDAALPLEQALRSLTHWQNLRRYPEKIAPEIRAAMREEQDFFTRELEKLDTNWADFGVDDGMSDMEHVEGWA